MTVGSIAVAIWLKNSRFGAQLAAIRAGFGIGICQAVVAARQPDLVRVLPDAFHMTLETWIVMHEDMRTNTRCRVVFDELVDRLPTQPR